MSTGREILSQLSPGDFLGKQKAEIAARQVGDAIQLGTVLGEARGLSYRNNPQDESKPAVALVGPFKFIPVSPERPELWAMRCFLPSTIHSTIIGSLQGDNMPPIDKSPKRGQAIDVMLGAVVPIVLAIGVRKTDTAIGYEYITTTNDNVPLELKDPLQALSARAGIKQIAGPVAEVANELFEKPVIKKKK